MKLVKMLTPPIKASVIVFAFLAALSARAYDWASITVDKIATIPAGETATVEDGDIAAVTALSEIKFEDANSRLAFSTTEDFALDAKISGPGGVSKEAAPAISMTADGGKITFNGDVYFNDIAYFTLGNCLINNRFGANRINGGYQVYRVRPGCTVEFSSSGQIVREYLSYLYGSGTFALSCKLPQTGCAQCNFESGTRLELKAANLLNCGSLSMAGANPVGTVIDIGGFDQSIHSLYGGSTVAADKPSLCEVTSETAAALTVDMSAVNSSYDIADRSASVIYTGAITVNHAIGAAFTNRLWNGVSTTTGDLNVKGGTLMLAGNYLWAGPRVNVSGGRLVAQATTGSFSEETAVALSEAGVLEVPAGCIAKVKKSLSVEGTDVELNGIRKAANLALDYPGFFAGEGAVSTLDSDPRPALSAALSVEGLIEVEDVTPGVEVGSDAGIVAAAGTEMAFAWARTPAETTTYAFTAKASGDAVVSVYVDGGDTPVDTVTAADGAKQVTLSSAEAVRVRLVVAGETGSARFYGFANEISAKIYAPKGGVNVTGANVGTNYVAFGESLSFTIARVFDSDDRIASGLNVNGRFIAFDDLPDATFAWTVDDFDTTVIIETVYDETTYYVDDKYGDDDKNNGRHSSKAFKTIKHAMELANSGYTIVVAPGTYGDEPGDEVMGSEGDWCRVSIKSGVTLKASGSAAETIILGREATEPIEISGYSRSGTDSARCVTMAENTRIEGFTLTGGCATTDGSSHTTGGGVFAANVTNCRIVNCIISNNYAATTASGGDYGLYLRCLFANNKSGNTYGHGLRGGAKCYNCYFKDQADGTSGGSDLLYSTFACGGARPTHNQGGKCVGCVFNGNAAPSSDTGTPYSYTLFTTNYRPESTKAVVDTETCTDVALNGFGLDSGARPSADSVVRNFGEPYADYLAKMLAAGWTEEEASLDFAGNPRCLDGRVDAGCCEYDCRGEMATMLDPLGFLTVASVAPTATMGDDLALTMPAGASLDVDWASSVTEGSTEYSFDAEVSGEAVLEAYLDDADEPYAVVREADGKTTVDVVKTGDAAVRLVVRGESGEAKVSKFVNAIYAIVLAPSGGISIDGAQFGTNYIAQGSSLTFTLQRKFDSSDVLATGVTVDGEYVSFDEHPEGVTLTVDSKATSVRVDAVYAESLNEVYVDDASGSDTANYGRHPANPFKTIKRALGLVKSGDTVYVAPGVYGDEPDDEVMGELKFKAGTQNQQVEPYGFCRILIPEGVTVKAIGTPEETVIVGRKATEILSGGGCGADSARCAFLKGGARLIGFTLTGGYSTTVVSSAGTGSSDGGAAFSTTSAYGSLVDCIISNNVASSTGGGGYGLHYFGCLIGGNRAVQGYGQGVRYGYLYNCRLKETSTIGGAVSVCYALVNCTFDCPFGSTVIHSADYNVFNSVFTGGCIAPALYTTSASSTSTGTYYNCVFTAPPDAKAWTNGACRVVTATELDLDENGVPRKGSAAVDAGDYAWYVSKLSEYPDLKDRGLLGCQRVYNGALDIGAAEFDWRDTYRGDLGAKRWLAVEAASSNVVETANGAVRLGDGSELTLKFTIARLDGEKFVDIPFVQSGAGTLTATLDGAVIEPKGGAFVLKATAAEQTLVLSYSGEGYADFTKMRRNAGVLLIVR